WQPSDERAYTFAITEHVDGLLHLDSLPMWQELLEDLCSHAPVPQMAARFHHGLAHAIRNMVARIRDMRWANSLNTVALSGGCFQNKLLLEELVRLLERDGLTCILHVESASNHVRRC